jgi:hypothetical protein
VFENVAYGLRLRKRPADEIKTRVEAILEKLGLAHLAARYPDQLSGGQQQRVAICRALVYEPKVLLLDEPLSNLDAKLREEARFWIRKLILELGICAIMVTHDQSEALAIADHVLLLKGGSIVQDGTPIQIYGGPTISMPPISWGPTMCCRAPMRRRRMAACDHPLRWLEPAGDLARCRAAARCRRHPRRGPGRDRGGHIRADATSHPLDVEGCIYLGDKWEYRLKRGSVRLRAQGHAELSSMWRTAPCSRLRPGCSTRDRIFVDMSAGPRIALIHATPVAIEPILQAFKALWPEAEPVSILDDSLSVDRAKSADITPAIHQRMSILADYGVSLGAEGDPVHLLGLRSLDRGGARRLRAFRCSSPTRRCSRRPSGMATASAWSRPSPLGRRRMEAEFTEDAQRVRPGAKLATRLTPLRPWRRCAQAMPQPITSWSPARPGASASRCADAGAFLDIARAQDACRAATSVPVLSSPDAAVRKVRRLLGA